MVSVRIYDIHAVRIDILTLAQVRSHRSGGLGSLLDVRCTSLSLVKILIADDLSCCQLVSSHNHCKNLHLVNPCSLGPVPLATQSVLLSTVSTTFQAPYSLGVATSVRLVVIPVILGACLTILSSIGNLLGEKKANRASVAANAAMLVSICVALFLRFAYSFTDFLFMTIVPKWRPCDFSSDVGIHVQ